MGRLSMVTPRTVHAVSGKVLPEIGRHRSDAVFWTAHTVPGMSLPVISRAFEL